MSLFIILMNYKRTNNNFAMETEKTNSGHVPPDMKPGCLEVWVKNELCSFHLLPVVCCYSETS